MSDAIQSLVNAQKYALSVRPKVGGFPYLAEALRLAGVTRNIWQLPSCQCVYLTNEGPVVSIGQPLLTGNSIVPPFDQERLILALRVDQSGKSTFEEFLKASWEAGVVRYDVDFERRSVSYFGVLGETYIESYPAVELPKI